MKAKKQSSESQKRMNKINQIMEGIYRTLKMKNCWRKAVYINKGKSLNEKVVVIYDVNKEV